MLHASFMRALFIFALFSFMRALWLASYPDGHFRDRKAGKYERKRLPAPSTFHKLLSKHFGDSFVMKHVYAKGGGHSSSAQAVFPFQLQGLLQVSQSTSLHFTGPLDLWPESCRIMRSYCDLPLDCYSVHVHSVSKASTTNGDELTHRIDVSHVGLSGMLRISRQRPLLFPHWPAHVDTIASCQGHSSPSACLQAWGINGHRGYIR
jgi:hypothetical protein